MDTRQELFAECGCVWAIDERMLGLLAENGLERENDPEARKPRLPTTTGAVAVLPISGVITQRGGWYGTSADGVGKMLDQVLAMPEVGAVVFDINSPGGSVFGVGELGSKIRAARGKKPLIAVANSMAASAAYWIASAADQVIVTPGGQVGSIGVFSAHVDLSKALDAAGVKVTFIKAGKYKTEGNAYEPLGEEAATRFQIEVDTYYSQFLRAVADGRGTTVADVQANYGQGRMMTADEAEAAGLVDRIATLDEVLAGMQRNAKDRRRAMAEEDWEAAELEMERAG